MLPVLGMLVVLVSVLGGFVLENGKLVPLAQPAEVVIILGAALGTLLTANPLRLLGKLGRGVGQVFRGSPPDRNFYVSTLVMLHALFEFARRNGATKLEEQIDHPEHSIVFRRHAAAVREAGVLDFLCDTLRMITSGRTSAHDLDNMLEQESEVREQVSRAPVNALAALADALPGLGIISAVLGVVITMNSVAQSPKVIGEKVGAALIGTFLGIFLSYGFVGPVAAHMERNSEAEIRYFQVLRASIAAYAKGMPVAITLEFARRSIPPDLRPGFLELERACRPDSGKVVEIPP